MELGEMEKDFLGELATIGGGNAATALSKILNQTVRLKVPDIYLLDYSQLFDKLGQADEKTVAVFANISEPTGGLMLLLLNIKSVNHIFKSLGLKELQEKDITLEELEESAITEISNILFNTYLGGLSILTKKTITSDRPFSLFDMLGAILNYPINVMPEVIEKIVFMDSSLYFDNKVIDGTLIMITNYEHLKEHMKAFGV